MRQCVRFLQIVSILQYVKWHLMLLIRPFQAALFLVLYYQITILKLMGNISLQLGWTSVLAEPMSVCQK